MKRHQKEATEFAQHITDLGFQVHLSKSGTSGFITDETGSRVLSFEIDGFFSKLHGNYGPPSSDSGTGWGLDVTPGDLNTKEDVHKALYAAPPRWCGNGWKYLSTVAQYKAAYQSSSNFIPFKEVTSG